MNSPTALSAPISYPPASLLGLPRELRDIIYGFAFDQSRDGRYERLCVHEPPPECERQQARTVLALSLVNHQIHDEVLEDYYRDNTFRIMVGWYDVVDVVAGDRALFDVYLPTLNNPAAIQKLDILVNLEEPSKEVCDWCLMRRLSNIKGQGSQFESLAEGIRRERDGNLKYSIKSEQAWQALDCFERCCEPRVKKVHKGENQTLWKTSSYVRKAEQDLVPDPWMLFLPTLKSLRISFTATRNYYYTSAQCLIGRVVVTFAKAFSKVPDFRFKVECWEGLPRNDEKVDRYWGGGSIDGISATSEAPLYWSCDPPLLMCGKVQQKSYPAFLMQKLTNVSDFPLRKRQEMVWRSLGPGCLMDLFRRRIEVS